MKCSKNIKNAKNTPWNGDYFCTWSSQDRWQNDGNDAIYMRDRMDEDFLFSADGVLCTIPQSIRSGLAVILDDGWDVLTGSLSDKNRERFGSLILSEDKFPSFSGTPKQRLKKISDKIKSLGFAGIGLWIAVQCEGEYANHHCSSDDARAYWEQRAKWCDYAGILYWKVDWGEHCNDIEYMQMMSECVKKYAKKLKIEHTYVRAPLNDENDLLQNRNRYEKTLQICDYFRSYDVCAELSAATTMERIANLLICKGISNAVINCEDELYLAAALGLTGGIMRSRTNFEQKRNSNNTDEAIRMVNWHKIAPPFELDKSGYVISDETFTDEFFFDTDPAIWPYYGQSTRKQSAPSAIARNISLPEIYAENGKIKPYVVCSQNSFTGAYSIAALPRTMQGVPHTECKCTACILLNKCVPIGIFGVFDKLKFSFNQTISHKKIYARDLCETKAYEITDKLNIDANSNSIEIDGDIIEKYGRRYKSYTDEISAPGLEITFE